MNPPQKKCDSCKDELTDKWYPVVSGGKIFYFCYSCAGRLHKVITALGGEENEL